MRVQLAFPVFRAFDSSGDPLAGGKLYTYDTITTTPRATYDNDGAANANPVILDANGEAEVWLDNGLYRLVLHDADDILQWTIDSVTGIVAPASAAETKTGTDDTLAITPAGLTLEVIDDRAFAADAEADDDYVITLSPAPAALYTGMTVKFSANTANTGACTLNVNALGAKSIKKNHDQDPATGDIESGQVVTVAYDGTNFQMQSQLGVSSAVSDIAYDATSWNGVTTIAPSKNAVRDKIESMFQDGLLVRAKFEFKDTDEIYINAGLYHHAGTAEQFVYWDSQITFVFGVGGSNGNSENLGANEWQYLYLDDSAIVTNASPLLIANCFLNNTTAPTWSDAKHGWYNGNDRCIFAIRTLGGSLVEVFYHSGNTVLHDQAIAEFAAADPTTSYVDLDIATTAPGFATEAILYGMTTYVDGAAYGYWRTNGSSGAGLPWGYVSAAGSDSNTFMVTTDSSQIIEHKITANNNTVTIFGLGWKFPIGM